MCLLLDECFDGGLTLQTLRHQPGCRIMFCLSAGLTVYSGIMFGQLRLAVPDAVLFGDIGQAAFGRLVCDLPH